jgi:hypothetical protein
MSLKITERWALEISETTGPSIEGHVIEHLDFQQYVCYV